MKERVAQKFDLLYALFTAELVKSSLELKEPGLNELRRDSEKDFITACHCGTAHFIERRVQLQNLVRLSRRATEEQNRDSKENSFLESCPRQIKA